MGKNENAYRIMLDEPEGRRPLGRPSVDARVILKIDLKVVRWESLDWI